MTHNSHNLRRKIYTARGIRFDPHL